MSVSEMIIKGVGIALVVVGFCLILSAVGINILGVSADYAWLAFFGGLIMIGAGIVIVRGGNVTL